MLDTIEKLKRVQKIEENAEKQYRKLLKKLNKPEYSDLKNLTIRLLVDTMLHRRLIEALIKTYEDAMEIVKGYGGEEPTVAIIPGVPSMVMPMEFGRIGDRVPPEELIEEFLKTFPEIIVVPDGSFSDVLEEHARIEGEMVELYGQLSRRAFHPAVKGALSGILRNEEQHVAIMRELIKKYGKKD